MRPLRLAMTAFGPYAGTEVIDFDALTELGLFVVAGNNGSGKTTIFDALHYGLFGTLPGRRATYVRLKSDHADDAVECSVTLDFAAGGRQWRVERSPKQTRRKRRGNGVTSVDRRATLYRLDHGIDGAAAAVANKIGEVDERCRELVGLSGRQFERVALLPQGEFSRLLTESGADRRELLRTLFSSEVFGDATTLLVDQAAEASAADRSANERLQERLQSLCRDLGTLVGQTVEPKNESLTTAIADQRAVHERRAASVAELHAAAQRSARNHQRAVDTHQRLARRRELQQRLDEHRLGDEQHRIDLARLADARSAIPVVSNAKSLEGHRHKLQSVHGRVAELHRDLVRACSAAGFDEIERVDGDRLERLARAVADRFDELAERRATAHQLADLESAAARIQADRRRVDDELRTLAEQHEIGRAQLRQSRLELDRLAETGDVDRCEAQLRTLEAVVARRTELGRIESEQIVVVATAAELDDEIAQVQAAHDDAHDARLDHGSLQRRADEALAAHDRAVRRHQAALQYRQAATQLASDRAELDKARTRAVGLWDAFIAGTAARVAETLDDESPCPVCGSCTHPAPATLDGDAAVITESDVTSARSQVDSLQGRVRTAESRIEQLRAEHVDITTLSPVELQAEITTTKAMALGARTIADEARRSASRCERLEVELAEARRARLEIDTELRSLEQRQNRLEGALGESSSEPLASMRRRVEQAEQARDEADAAQARRSTLQTTIDQTEARLETTGIARVAAQSRRAAIDERLAERRAEVDRARARLDAIDTELGCTDFEFRARALRHAGELIPQLATALALADDAADAVRRGQAILDERVAQSPFPSAAAAEQAFAEPRVIDQLDAHTAAHAARGQRLEGQLQELAGVSEPAPDLEDLQTMAQRDADAFTAANTALITDATTLDRIEAETDAITAERAARHADDLDARRLERVAALAKGDNDRNTSLENWVLAAHLRDVVELANLRLARSTHHRFQLCVFDDGENKRGKWGLDLGVEDTVTGTRRPTAGLSGGELFQASLALALGLADAVMNQSAGVRIDALFIDEGFGSLDETSVERAIDLLDELRDRGAMVGVITHVPALLDALPLGVRVTDADNGPGSTIRQSQRAA